MRQLTLGAIGGIMVHVKKRLVSELKSNPRNARTHSKKQQYQIAASIKQFGFLNPILIDEDDVILAGHGRVDAARSLGIEDVPTVRVDHLNAAQKRAYILADNRIALNAGWDTEILAIELEFLTTTDIDFDVEITGFEIAEIDLLLDQPAPVEPEPGDEVPSPADLAITRFGDIWEAGERSNLAADDLRQIAKMSTKSDGPLRAIRELNKKGIMVVVMPPLPGTFLDGAAMANQAGKPVIGLTLRYDRIDSFWFTLLHELSHVALHYDELIGSNIAFVDDMEIRSEDACEREADKLARDSLIPGDILTQVNWGAGTAHDDLITLATRARVHISVVAGRWQREHQNYKKFARLIDRNSIRAMLSDGKGLETC